MPPRRYDPALPETLEAITLKCLAKNPANRYPSAEDLRADLRRFLDGSRIMAEPVLAPPMDPGATSMMANTQYGDQTALGGGAGRDTTRPAGTTDTTTTTTTTRTRSPSGRSGSSSRSSCCCWCWRDCCSCWPATSAATTSPPVDQVTVPGVVDAGRHRRHPGARGRGLRGRDRVRQRPGAGQPGHRAGSRGRRRGRRGVDGDADGQPGSRARGRPRRRRPDADRGEHDPHPGGFRGERRARGERRRPRGPGHLPGPGGQRAGCARTPRSPSRSRPARARSRSPTWRVRPRRPPAPTSSSAGFTSITVQNEAERTTCPRATVIRVDPAPGTEVPPNQAITLVLSSGREQVTVPPVEGLNEQNARSQLEAAGLSVTVSRAGRVQPRAGRPGAQPEPCGQPAA